MWLRLRSVRTEVFTAILLNHLWLCLEFSGVLSGSDKKRGIVHEVKDTPRGFQVVVDFDEEPRDFRRSL